MKYMAFVIWMIMFPFMDGLHDCLKARFMPPPKIEPSAEAKLYAALILVAIWWGIGIALWRAA